MTISQFIKEHLLAKSFYIHLDDEFCYPTDKNFRFPNKLVIRTAIENYGISNKEAIEFLNSDGDITFILDGKEKYRAALKLGRGRYNQGYYIKCRQIF